MRGSQHDGRAAQAGSRWAARETLGFDVATMALSGYVRTSDPGFPLPLAQSAIALHRPAPHLEGRGVPELPSRQSPIEVALGRFAAAWLEGKAPDPEQFCRAHPECGPDLRPRIDAFLATAGSAESRAMASADDAGVPQAASLAGRTLGGFRLLREIGRGGMGVVYEAVQIPLRRHVALKVLPAHLTLLPDAVSRFRREASMAARLRHPGIVQIHEIGHAEGAHFFAMEFVEGAPLSDVLDRMRQEDRASLDGGRVGAAVSSAAHGRVEFPAPPEGEERRARTPSSAWNRSYIETVCRLTAQVADALEHAHEAGILHRDVKPSNILVREDGSTVLTDFGLAREEGLPSLTRTGEFAGTPYYVSPEQAMARRMRVDHRTDVYSLGVTLYELLTLRRPFEGTTSQEVLGKIITKEPTNPKRFNPLLPRDLVTIVLKAIEKDADRRYLTAADFAADLRAFLSFRPVAARPASPATRILKFARRHRSSALAAILVSCGLVGAGAWRLVRVQIEEEEFRALLVGAEEAHGAGDVDRAISLVERAVTLRPEDPLASERKRTHVAERDRKLKEHEESRARERRLAEARAGVHRGRGLLSDCRALAEGLPEKRRRLRELEDAIRGPEGPDAKLPLWALEEEIGADENRAKELETQAENDFHGALALAGADGLPEARIALADLWLARFETAVEAGREAEAAIFARQVKAYDEEARHVDRLEGEGTLTLRTDPPGARGYLFLYVERQKRLWPAPFDLSKRKALPLPEAGAPVAGESTDHVAPSAYDLLACGPANLLGETPIEAFDLPHGSYLLVLRKPGFVDVRYPVLVHRGREAGPLNPVRLHSVAEHPDPEEWVYVPEGLSILGGDAETLHSWERREESVGAFFVGRFEVTCAEYLEFLNDPETIGMVLEARKRGELRYVPREAPASGERWRLPEEERDRFEIPREFRKDWPVLGVSWEDARAYVSWLNRRAEKAGEAWAYALPREVEWERAARGADGRCFPWGNGFDWTFCKGGKSRVRRAQPEPVGLFPADESPFGVRDMGGGVWEWCEDSSERKADLPAGLVGKANRLVERLLDMRDGAELKAGRGGAWVHSDSRQFRSAERFGDSQRLVSANRGFRVVCRVRAPR